MKEHQVATMEMLQKTLQKTEVTRNSLQMMAMLISSQTMMIKPQAEVTTKPLRVTMLPEEVMKIQKNKEN